MATKSDVEPMIVDQAGTDQTILPPSIFEFLNPRQDFDSVPDPAFDIYDVSMELTDINVDATRDIVSSGGFDDLNDCLGVQSSKYGGKMPRFRYHHLPMKIKLWLQSACRICLLHSAVMNPRLVRQKDIA